MGDGTEIIIKGGGSVHVIIGPDGFSQPKGDSKTHSHAALKMKSIIIKNETGDVVYDSDQDPSAKSKDGMKFEVRVKTSK